MEIDYIPVGDYLLPAVKQSDPPDAPPLGYYGVRRKAYLREHRPILYNSLLLREELYPQLRETDEAAENRMRTIVDKEQAREVILSELVYD